MPDKALLTFRGLAERAFRAQLAEFDGEDLRWEPALRGVRSWTELEPLKMSPTEAFMLSHEAFLFCLPAYMIGGLSGAFFPLDSVLRLLYTPGTPWESWNRWDWHHSFKEWDRLMSKLTTDQKHVVHLWLLELAARFPEEQVIGDYESERIKDRVAQMISNYWGAY